MIAKSELSCIGRFGKAHGIKGEITAQIPDTDIDPSQLKCIFVELDGLMVPFFIDQWRTKGAETVLLTIDGIDTQDKTERLVNKEIFVLNSDMPAIDPDQEGFYLSDLIGYKLVDDDNKPVGIIADFDDSTENYLFSVKTPHGNTFFVPANPDLIAAVDTETQTIQMTLPQGLADL